MEYDDLNLDVLLNKREYDYHFFSKKILERYTAALTRAVQHLTQTDRDVTWHSIERVPNLPQYVSITGNMEIREGDQLLTSTGIVIATEENKKLYSNTFRFPIPMKMLELGSATILYKHIRDYQLALTKLTEPEDIAQYLIEAANALDNVEMIDDPKSATIMQKITKPLTIDGFDTADLNETQMMHIRIISDGPRNLN